MEQPFHRDREASAETADCFRMWVERLIFIGVEVQKQRCMLADAGVVCGADPEILSSDPPFVVRAKECLLRLFREKRRIFAEMAQIGAHIADEQMWEILVPGGPEDGAFLSWMLGERAIGYYRATDSLLSKRLPLPGVDQATVAPVRH